MPRRTPTPPISPLAGQLSVQLRAARVRLGWTQAKLARALGISLVSYSRIENSQYLPTLQRIDHLARILGVPLTSLLLASDGEDAHAAAMAQVMHGLPADAQAFLFRFAQQFAEYMHGRQGPQKQQLPAIE